MIDREAEIRRRWAGLWDGQGALDVHWLLELVDKLRSHIEELEEGIKSCGMEYRPDDGPRPYWRNTRALDAEYLLRKHTEWQPIETAPKNGSWVLLRAPSGYTGRPYMVAVAHYEKDREPHTPWQMSETGTFEEYGCTPTHWMPLPDKETR